MWRVGWGHILALAVVAALLAGCGSTSQTAARNAAFQVTVNRGGTDVFAQGQARVGAGGRFVLQAVDAGGTVLSEVSELSPQPGQWASFIAHLPLPARAAQTARVLRVFEVPAGAGPPRHLLTVPIPSGWAR